MSNFFGELSRRVAEIIRSKVDLLERFKKQQGGAVEILIQTIVGMDWLSTKKIVEKAKGEYAYAHTIENTELLLTALEKLGMVVKRENPDYGEKGSNSSVPSVVSGERYQWKDTEQLVKLKGLKDNGVVGPNMLYN